MKALLSTKKLNKIFFIIFIFLLMPISAQADYQPKASEIRVDASGFGGSLSTSDNNLQKVAEKVDALNASTLTYDNDNYPTTALALDHLLYITPSITSFTNNKNSLENGTAVTSTTLNWTVNKTMVSESLNNSIGSLSPASLLTYTHTSTYSTNRTYTLTVNDGTTSASASTSVTFLNSNYYGVSSSATLDDTAINALTTALASSKAQTRTLSPSGQHIYIAYPAAYGAAIFTVNGLSNDDWTLSVQTHVNASGASVSYNVYRTNSLLTGTYTIGVS